MLHKCYTRFIVLAGTTDLARINSRISPDIPTDIPTVILRYPSRISLNPFIRKMSDIRSRIRMEDRRIGTLYALSFILDGLGKIHEKQEIHRDFHTGNIL